ncbi:MAG TPA: response regulator [Thermoanaerobaculia bacterium]|nr:response regulator [Thermoanaerobaculia bacterium]
MTDLGGLSVLVVEDDADFRAVAVELLSQLGLSDTVAVDRPSEALDWLGKRPFDVLLTDLWLGTENGIQLAGQARQLASATRAIVMSAYSTARDVAEATAAGVISVLDKPFQAGQLEGALRKAATASTGIWGEVHGLSLTDMLQMYHFSRRSVALCVSGPQNGRILFSNGEIVRAETERAQGVAAMAELLRATVGMVRTEPLPEHFHSNVDGEFQAILLETLHSIDEENRPNGDGSPEANPRSTDPTIDAFDFFLEAEETGHASGINHYEPALDLSSANGHRTGERTMATEKQLQETLAKIQSEISGFIGASVVDLETGMTLAVNSVRGDLDLSAASAYNSEMVKQKLKIIKALNLNTTLEDMLLTLGDQIHLIKIISAGTFIYLAADRASTNLAIVRAAVAKHVAGLQ